MSKPKGYIGIDPGSKGAMACIVPTTGMIHLFSLNVSASNVKSIHAWLNEMSTEHRISTITVEGVHALSRVSAKSTFNFGFNTGFITSLALLQGVTVETVLPKIWQQALELPKKPEKADIARRVMELYPELNHRLYGPRGGLHDGLSDAVGIAHYTYLTKRKNI